MKNICLVGCSSGIGLELLKLFLHNGERVVASSREASSCASLLALEEEYSKRLNLLNIDVCNMQSVQEGVAKSWDILGSVDILIFNAGVYETMDASHWNISHFEQMADINYLGGVRLLQGSLKHLRAQKGGRVVFNASLSSYFGLPYGGAYSASKAALLNFAESIQPEMDKENIEIQIINHGFVKTRLTSKNDFEMPELMSPECAAKKIYEEIRKPYRFEIKFPFKLALFLTILAMLPYKLSLKITKNFLK